jgi:hypothetical protein
MGAGPIKSAFEVYGVGSKAENEAVPQAGQAKIGERGVMTGNNENEIDNKVVLETVSGQDGLESW